MENEVERNSQSHLTDAEFREFALNDFKVLADAFDITQHYELEEILDGFSQAGIFIKEVEREGGGEGEGEHTHIVYSVTDETGIPIYWMITGFHNSEWGTEWDDRYARVEPKQVTITKYVGIQ